MTVSTTGLIGWTPAQAQTGDAAVVLRVTDGRGGEAQQSFTISVAAAPGSNRPPEIASSAPTAAAPGQPFSYAVEATDPDGDAVIF